ncbi:MAG: hypothetical protein NTY73_00320 [Candidatus Micrarchaeota archaeon]|nr:hypothetical protein [Candidatus Micrarchaeota archaeon]
MKYKLVHDEGKKLEESISDAIKTARPMSLLSDRFFQSGMARVEGDLIKVNEEFFPDLPLKKDKIVKDLSLFVNWSGKNVEVNLFGLNKHGRVVYLNLVFSDKYGNTYKYIGLKGAGMPEKSDKGIQFGDLIKSGRYSPSDPIWGLQGYSTTILDWNESNEILKNGGQTSAPIAIIKLKAVIMKNGEKKSVEELKEEGLIPKFVKDGDRMVGYQPVIYLRAFSEVMRLGDVGKDDIEKFANEHGMTTDNYLAWWAKKLAKNVAKLHNAGKAHGYLLEQNITLDGCFVDNETIRNFGKSTEISMEAYAEDATDILCDDTIGSFAIRAGIKSFTEFDEIFLREYLENRRDMEKVEFEVLYSKLSDSFIKGSSAVHILKEEYKKKFGEELETRKLYKSRI